MRRISRCNAVRNGTVTVIASPTDPARGNRWTRAKAGRGLADIVNEKA